MKSKKLGSFIIDDNQVLVIDPGYEDRKYGHVFKNVCNGKYQAFVVQSRLREPLFPIDELPDFFRIASLQMVHEDYKDKNLDFKKVKSLSVDYGQMAFLKNENFYKKHETPLKMLNNYFHMLQNLIHSKNIDINNWEDMKKNINNIPENYKDILEEYETEADKIKYLDRLIKSSKESNKMNQEQIDSQTPSGFVSISSDDDFYEIMKNASNSKNEAEVVPYYGVNSSTGVGDGYYSIYVSRNKKKEIIAIKAVFLKDNLIF